MANVLVVDADPEVAARAARHLGAVGHDVAVASSGRQALDLIRRGTVEVLVTDLALGEQLGALGSAADRLEVPTIVTVGQVPARRLLSTGRSVTALVEKPFTDDELALAVERAVESRLGFAADLHGVAIVDLLQLLHHTRRSVEVTVRAARGDVARVLLHDGEIIDAFTRSARGAAALRELLGWDTGRIQTRPLPAGVAATIDRRFEALILDSLRLNDEAGRGTPPPVDALAYLHDLFAALASTADLDPSITVVGVSPSRGEAVSLRGSIKVDGHAEAALGLLADATRLGDARRGRCELISDDLGIATLWDLSRDAMFILADRLQGKNASWFRTAASLLWRGLTDDALNSKEERDGKDR